MIRWLLLWMAGSRAGLSPATMTVRDARLRRIQLLLERDYPEVPRGAPRR